MPSLEIAIETWPLNAPFRITGYVFTEAELITVTLRDGAAVGRGEAAGVYYRDETPQSMAAEIEAARAQIEAGVSRKALLDIMPAGGARNAVDCAFWDLEAKLSGTPAWQAEGLAAPVSLRTTYTVGAGSPDEMAAQARRYAPAPRLKLKLTGDNDAARLRAVRAARPDAWIGVDANQAYTRHSLDALLSIARECDVRLIEQPLPIGQEDDMEGIVSSIPFAADESVQGLADVAKAAGRFAVVNIKLDKCGGLTEGLLMASEIRRLGMMPMVGCMQGTSLSMAPGCLLGQVCDHVDMDGAMFLADDRTPATVYRDGEVFCEGGWGDPREKKIERC